MKLRQFLYFKHLVMKTIGEPGYEAPYVLYCLIRLRYIFSFRIEYEGGSTQRQSGENCEEKNLCFCPESIFVANHFTDRIIMIFITDVFVLKCKAYADIVHGNVSIFMLNKRKLQFMDWYYM